MATIPVDRRSALRGLYGDLTPIAVVRPSPQDGEPPIVVDCPGRDFEVAPGEFATMLGTAADFEAHRVDIQRQVNQEAVPRRASVISRAMSVVTGVLKDFDPGFYRAGAAVLCLVSIPTLLLWLTYSRPGCGDRSADSARHA